MKFGYEVFHSDISIVAAFYRDVLGFRVSSQDPVQPGTDYCTVSRKSLTVGISRRADAVLSPRKPPEGCEIVLRVDDITADHDRVLASGWPIEDPLQDRPWGLTDFRVFDPTGLYIRITDIRRPQ